MKDPDTLYGFDSKRALPRKWPFECGNDGQGSIMIRQPDNVLLRYIPRVIQVHVLNGSRPKWYIYYKYRENTPRPLTKTHSIH